MKKTSQVGRSYKNSGRINNNQHKAGHRKGQRRGSGSQPLDSFRDTKLMKRECYNQKGPSMSVRW